MQKTRRATSPWLAALILAALAQTLFSLGITRIDHLVFDETHYVPAARHIAALDAPSNIEHPLVGKTMIAGGIQLLGDGPLGWRLPSTIAGTAAILGVFVLTLAIFGSVPTAVTASMLAMINGMIYVQARIAMIDAFLAAFIIWGVALAALAAKSRKPWPRAIGAGVCLGLATGCKWMAGPFVAAVCIGLVWLRRRDRWMVAGGLMEGPADMRHMGGVSSWKLAFAIGIVSVITYFGSFWPAFLYENGALSGPGALIKLQETMFRLQTQILAPHTYQSGWMSWAFDIRPIWYLFEGDGIGQRGIIMLANPLTTAMGLVGAGICTVRWWRTHDPRIALSVSMWLFSWLIFAAIPKSIGFAYYYVPASLMLAIVTAAALHRDDGKHRGILILAILIGIIGFMLFYPIYAGLTMDYGFYDRLMWLESWR